MVEIHTIVLTLHALFLISWRYNCPMHVKKCLKDDTIKSVWNCHNVMSSNRNGNKAGNSNGNYKSIKNYKVYSKCIVFSANYFEDDLYFLKDPCIKIRWKFPVNLALKNFEKECNGDCDKAYPPCSLVGITRLVPYHHNKQRQLIWRSGTSRSNLLVSIFKWIWQDTSVIMPNVFHC